MSPYTYQKRIHDHYYLQLQDLFLKTRNIAVPNSYFEEIKSWSENDLLKKKSFFSSKSNNELVNWLRSQKTDVILISRGDPLWFGIGRILLENFSKDELSFYPSNTCIQLAFSKLKIPWQDTVNVSIHGRDSARLVAALKARPSSLAIITDSNNKSLEIIKKNLSELNLIDFYDFWLCEEIGFDNENIRKLNLKESLPSDISNLNIAVLTKTKENYSNNNLPLFGINDNVFKTFDGTELANGNHSMRKTSSNQDDASGLHILVVNYTNEVNPTDEEMSSQVKEYAPVFSNENFPGMIGKTMINSTDGNVYGGVYFFKSRSAIDDYLISELWTGFEGDNNTNVYKKDIYMVAPISTISNGVPVL